MSEWLRERRFMLLVVGITIPLIAAMSFWSIIRPNWPFWLVCYLAGFPAFIVAAYGGNRLGEFWSRLGNGHRLSLGCFAAAVIWFLLVLFPDDPSNRFFEATATVAGGLLLWGGYAVFSRVIDRLWFRIHKG